MDTAALITLRTGEDSGEILGDESGLAIRAEGASARFLASREGLLEGEEVGLLRHKPFTLPTTMESKGSPMERATPCTTAVRVSLEAYQRS